MDGEIRVPSESLLESRTKSKVLVGQKRGILEYQETFEHKRVKTRDLQSVFRSQGNERKNKTVLEVSSDSRVLDLNVDADPIISTVGDNAPTFIEQSYKVPTSLNKKMEHNDGLNKCRGFDFDLNSEAVSISIDDPFYPYKSYEDLRPRDDLECGSSVGPLEEKDITRVAKELKQNNMANPPGAVRMRIPKPRVRKNNKNDAMKRKLELAKKEEVDRFARFAAPSGLLNELNPGIINHVRNRKHVYSIIESLVRSAKTENRHFGSKENDQTKNCTTEVGERMEQENVHSSEVNRFNDYTFFSKSKDLNTKEPRGYGDSYMGEARSIPRIDSQCDIKNENDGLELKLSSSGTAVLENGSCLSNEESEKAANVASKWLELLNQDIRGRITALRRSKKRAHAVIATDLPFLNSREFSSNIDKPTVDEHSVKWSTLFVQMHKKLSEEENHLESWLNQVKEMQLHCEKGLHKSNLYHASKLHGSLKNDDRSGGMNDNSDNDIAAMAAAASIFSTSNFLSSM